MLARLALRLLRLPALARRVCEGGENCVKVRLPVFGVRGSSGVLEVCERALPPLSHLASCFCLVCCCFVCCLGFGFGLLAEDEEAAAASDCASVKE